MYSCSPSRQTNAELKIVLHQGQFLFTVHLGSLLGVPFMKPEGHKLFSAM